MADLDDFFAKKDRKKSKGKKFATTEDVAKKLEDTSKKIEKPKTKDKIINSEGAEDNQDIKVCITWILLNNISLCMCFYSFEHPSHAVSATHS